MASPTEIIAEFLQNTATEKIEATAERLVVEGVTHVSLNFDNPELKRILPWTCTYRGRSAYASTFIQVASYRVIEDFEISALFGAGEDVGMFHRHARCRGAEVVHFA